MEELAELINSNEGWSRDYNDNIAINGWEDDCDQPHGICHDQYRVLEFVGDKAVVRNLNYTITFEDAEGNEKDTIVKRDYFTSMDDAVKYTRSKLAEASDGSIRAYIYREFGCRERKCVEL